MNRRGRQTRAEIIRAQRSWGVKWNVIGARHGISAGQARLIGNSEADVPFVPALEPGEFRALKLHATTVRHLWHRQETPDTATYPAVQVRYPADVLAALDQRAEAEGITRAELLRRIAARHIEETT